MSTSAKYKKTNLKDDLSIVWDLLKSLAFFLGIYLFFLGWLYLRSYFSEFGISTTSVAVDIPSYYNYGFLSIMCPSMSILFFVFFILFSLIYYNRGQIKHAYIYILLSIFLLFSTSFYLVQSNASQDARGILTKQTKTDAIYFDFTYDFLKSMKKDTLEYDLLKSYDTLFRDIPSSRAVKLIKFNNTRQLSLIYENNDSYFTIYNSNEIDTLTGKCRLDDAIQIFNISKKNTNYASKIKTYHEQ